jgi:hypothetical protein
VEPLASSLFGFHWTTDYVVQEMERYHPSREPLGAEELKVNPGWFGEEIAGLGELGWAIGDDERFYRCATEMITTIYLRRTVGMQDRDEIDQSFERFILANANAKELIRAVMDQPSYRAGELVDQDDDDLALREKVVRAVGPQQLSRSLNDLTGFTWEYAGFDMMNSDTYGFRLLMGGVDGHALTRPVNDPSLTSVVTVKRLAQAAADYEVDNHIGDGGDHLLSSVNPDWTADDLEMEEVVASFYFQLMGIRPDDETVSEYLDLWADVAAVTDAETAWRAVVEAFFRDPYFITY